MKGPLPCSLLLDCGVFQSRGIFFFASPGNNQSCVCTILLGESWGNGYLRGLATGFLTLQSGWDELE